MLHAPYSINEPLSVQRSNSQPCIEVSDSILKNITITPIDFSSERLACKFIGDTMLLYWMKRNYFALVGIINLKTNDTQIITAEIAPDEVDYIINQLSAT